jgi:hypothetical protein
VALQNEKGEYEYNLKKIAFSYFKGFFVSDFLGIIPLEKIVNTKPSCWSPGITPEKLVLVFRFLRVNKLIKLNYLVEKYTPAYLVSLVRLLKIIIFYFFIIHMIGVIFTGNSKTLINNLPDWVKTSKDLNAFFRLYFYSIFAGIYFVLGNDFIYEDKAEKVFMIVINIISLITNANIFGYIGVTLKNSNVGSGDDTNLERIESINEFLNYQDIGDQLKYDINKYSGFNLKSLNDLYTFSNLSILL